MKRSVFISLFALVSLLAQADDLGLFIESSTGVTTSYEVSSLQKMTFEDGNVVLSPKNGEAIVTSIANIKRMYFDQVSAINAMLDAQPSNYAIYNVKGMKLAEGTATTYSDIPTTRLGSGLYLVRIGNKTFKIVK